MRSNPSTFTKSACFWLSTNAYTNRKKGGHRDERHQGVEVRHPLVVPQCVSVHKNDQNTVVPITMRSADTMPTIAVVCNALLSVHE